MKFVFNVKPKYNESMYCPNCAEDKDYKCTRKYEGSYRQYVVYTCPNCEEYYIFNRTQEDFPIRKKGDNN